MKILNLLKFWRRGRTTQACPLVKNLDHAVQFKTTVEDLKKAHSEQYGASGEQPITPGLYWAKQDSYKWWNLIVEVRGEAPFLRLFVWRRSNDQIIKVESAESIIWGPRIEPPK